MLNNFSYKIFNKYLFITFCCLFINCSKKEVSMEDIDHIMSSLSYDDLQKFKNYTIAIRQKTITEIIYLVTDDNNIDDIKAFVTVNRSNGRILNINSSLNEVEQDKIEKLIVNYNEFGYPYLSVDEEGNFCINPFFTDMQPYILCLREESKDLEIKRNLSVFKHYKNNLYINTRYQNLLIK